MKTLYETLGIPPDATPAAIKKAYRSAAQKHHPDKDTGDHEAFQAVQKAFDVLSDPERRQHYDATGSTDDIPTIRTQATAMLPALMQTAIEKNDVETTDLIAVSVQYTENEITSRRQKQREFTKRLDKREKALKRISRKSPGENVLSAVVQSDILQIKGILAQIDKDITIFTEVMVLLADYSYEVDAAPEEPRRTVMQPGEDFRTLFGRHFGV